MKKRKKPWHGYTVIYNSAYFKSIQCGMQKIPKAYHHTNITFDDYIFSPSSPDKIILQQKIPSPYFYSNISSS